MCGVHPGGGGVGEVRLEILESACDGKFIVAVEDEDIRHDYFVGGGVTPPLLCYDSMHALADGDDVNDLHVAEVCFGGVALLKNRSQRTGDEYANDSGGNCEGCEQEACQRGFCHSKHRPAHGPGQKRCCREVGSASSVDGESAFTFAQSLQGFRRIRPDILRGEIPEQKKSCWVGMSSHAAFLRASQHVKRSVFERMVAPCFENIGKIEDHDVIIRYNDRL